MLDRKEAPAFRPINQIHFPEIQLRHLSNGVPLHILKAGKLDVCRLEIIFRTGSYYEAIPAQAYFGSKMLNEGAGPYSSKELALLFDQYGAYIEASSGYEFITLSLYSLTKHLPKLLPVIQAMADTPSFPENEFKTVRQISLQKIRVEETKNNALAGKRFRNLIFGNHPYARTLELTDIERIKREDIQAFFAQQMRGNFELFLTGNFQDADLLLLEDTFGSLPYRKAPARNAVTFPELSGAENIIKRPDSLQSSIRYGKAFFGMDHPDYAHFSILNTILGGYFGSRLMKEIREEKGYTYGIYSSLVPLRERGFFVIGTDVIKEYTQATLDEINRQINILQEQPVSEQELETVRNYIMGTFLSTMTTPFAVADKYKNVYLKGMDLSFYNNYMEALKQARPEDLQSLARRHLQTDSLNTVIVG